MLFPDFHIESNKIHKHDKEFCHISLVNLVKIKENDAQITNGVTNVSKAPRSVHFSSKPSLVYKSTEAWEGIKLEYNFCLQYGKVAFTSTNVLVKATDLCETPNLVQDQDLSWFLISFKTNSNTTGCFLMTVFFLFFISQA